MPTLFEEVKRLLPEGTDDGRPATWTRCPAWPPDLFAVASTLVALSGCYSSPGHISPWVNRWHFSKAYLDEVTRVGKTWREQPNRVPVAVQRLWRTLLRRPGIEISRHDLRTRSWWDAALRLMAISDEASYGIGFVDPENEAFAAFVAQDLTKVFAKTNELPFLPHSLCIKVPESETCVQPKTRTPQVGCTLRSLSHHLALLPSVGDVRTRWLIGTHSATVQEKQRQSLNLLLVPFPYQIDGSCFTSHRYEEPTGDEPEPRGAWNFFSIQQNWLRWRGRKVSAQQIARFLVELIRQASREVREVHGLILPEGALDDSRALALARQLAKQTNLELFVSGSLYGREPDPQNQIWGNIFVNHRAYTFWVQSKHHRWSLDRSQIRTYHLGDALDPSRTWWERINVNRRECTFYVFRHGASLATFACEDLARLEPVHAVVRSVGPNLLIVLLMDGPQIPERWPARYATVFADDPGCAVLTLSSLGMVRRSSRPGERESRQIALWKEPGGKTEPLTLPERAHGLLVTLANQWEDSFTLDGRWDHKTTSTLSRVGVRPVQHPRPPAWLE